jgi:hypothetical protein
MSDTLTTITSLQEYLTPTPTRTAVVVWGIAHSALGSVYAHSTGTAPPGEYVQ